MFRINSLNFHAKLLADVFPWNSSLYGKFHIFHYLKLLHNFFLKHKKLGLKSLHLKTVYSVESQSP